MTHKVLFKDISKTIEVPEDVTLLEAAEEAGLDIPSSCRKGECGTCKIKKIMGDISVAEGITVTEAEAREGIVLSCVSKATTDLVCETTLQGEELQAEVIEIVERTSDTKSFHLSLGNREHHAFEPGQFITVGPVLDGKKNFRCYSISSSCENNDFIEITVKRQKKGLVSNYFNETVKVGDKIPAKKPSGNFKLEVCEEGNLMLVGCGSGITPLISMIRSLTQMKSQRKIRLLYGCRTEADIIFHEELLELEEENSNFRMEILLSRPNENWRGAVGRVDEDSILATLEEIKDPSLSLYTCGPTPIMEMAVEVGKAAGIPGSRCHMEAFAPPKSQLPDNFLTLEQMKELEIFSGLSDKALESLQPHIMFRNFHPGEMIVREGDFGNSAFYILEGAVCIYNTPLDLNHLGRKSTKKRTVFERLKSIFNGNERGDEFISSADVNVSNVGFNTNGLVCNKDGETLLPYYLPKEVMNIDGTPVSQDKIIVLPKGEMFGELAALFRSRRTATVSAHRIDNQPCKTLEIKTQALRILSKRNKNFKVFIEDRFRQRSLAQFLKADPLFSHCEKELIDEIILKANFYTYKPLELIIAEGDDNREFFIVLSGFVKLSKKLEEQEFNFHSLKKGDFFGELTLLSDGKTSCSVTAINNVQAIGLDRSLFDKLMKLDSPRELITQIARQRENSWEGMEMRVASLSLLSFGIDHQLVNGQSIMVINLDRCTRCDDCVTACATAHDGYPRFAREGKKIGNTMFPHSCMHCLDPLCMDGCPSGALHRSEEKGEVLINIDTCVGCTMCVTKCVYDNIVPLPIAEHVAPSGEIEYKRNPSNGKPVLKSMKCDLCVETGDPACVRSCPQDAMRRLTFDEIFNSTLQ